MTRMTTGTRFATRRHATDVEPLCEGPGTTSTPPAPEPVSLRVDPWAVTRVLIMVAAGLTLASVAGQAAKFGWGIERAGGLIPGFNLDHEGNFPTWYQSTSLGVCALLLALVATAAKRKRQRRVWRWRLLALVFLGCSIDEEAAVHEMLIRPMRSEFHADGWFHYAWVIPGAVFTALMAAVFWRFLMELAPKIRRLFIIAGVLYIGGALGMEMVGGYYATRYGVEHFAYVILTTVEEVLEMAGVIVFIHALLTHLGLMAVSCHVSAPGGPTSADA